MDHWNFEMDMDLKFEISLLSLKKIYETLGDYISALEEAKQIKKDLDNIQKRFENNETDFESVMMLSSLAEHAEKNQKQISEIQNRLNGMTSAMRNFL